MIFKQPFSYKIFIFVIILIFGYANIIRAQEPSQVIKKITSEKIINNELDIQQELMETNSATIIILNKITAKPVTENLKINQAKVFGNLSITVKKCVKNLDPYNLNSSMLISIDDTKLNETNNLFLGWLFSDNPSISTFEHSVFEIIPINCIHQ